MTANDVADGYLGDDGALSGPSGRRNQGLAGGMQIRCAAYAVGRAAGLTSGIEEQVSSGRCRACVLETASLPSDAAGARWG